MTDVIRIYHLRIAHQVANPEVGNPEICQRTSLTKEQCISDINLKSAVICRTCTGTSLASNVQNATNLYLTSPLPQLPIRCGVQRAICMYLLLLLLLLAPTGALYAMVCYLRANNHLCTIHPCTIHLCTMHLCMMHLCPIHLCPMVGESLVICVGHTA